MKNIILLSTLVFCLASCKSFHLSSIPEGRRLENRLPPLEPEFDTRSFGTHYVDIYGTAANVISGRYNLENELRERSNLKRTEIDTRKIYNREIIHNISESTGETKGIAVCRIGMRTRGITSYWNPVISIFTLGIANLFGYPASIYRDEIELIVDIYDMNDTIVGSYSDIGYGEAKMAMYHGYTKYDAKRLAHALAFKKALEGIKRQIKDDTEEITTLLTE